MSQPFACVIIDNARQNGEAPVASRLLQLARDIHELF